MASPELEAFLEELDPEYKDYAELLHNASFRKVKEIAAATPELLETRTKGLVPIGAAGAIVAAAYKATAGAAAVAAGQYSTVGARTFDIRTTQLSDQLQGLQAEVANLRDQLNEQAQGTHLKAH